jgi:RNA polymerase II subunit A small phosphatase-like protein
MKGLLILDLDETLIHSEEFPRTKESKEKFDFKVHCEGDDYWFMTKKRPFLKEFIEYIFNNFDIGIWTASTRDYASLVLKNIGIDESKLKFFYTRENCTLRLDYNTNSYYGIKNLQKLKKRSWAKPYTTKVGQMRELDRVLIVDDIVDTAVNNYSNLVLIKPFYFNEDDTELLKLISYLQKIKDEPNWRRIDKRNWGNKVN